MKAVLLATSGLLLSASAAANSNLKCNGNLTQYTMKESDWSKIILNTDYYNDHSIQSYRNPKIGEASEAFKWDGTQFDPVKMYHEDMLIPDYLGTSSFAESICLENGMIRGLEQVYNDTLPFGDDHMQVSKARFDCWNGIVINHLRQLIVGLGDSNTASPDTCMHKRAYWGDVYKFENADDCTEHCGHWGHSHYPVTDECGKAGSKCQGCAEGSGGFGAWGIPRSMIVPRIACSFLRGEGFWGGHTGPFLRRPSFGLSLRSDQNWFRMKWTGQLKAVAANPALSIYGRGPNMQQERQCQETTWLHGIRSASQCYDAIMNETGCSKRYVTYVYKGPKSYHGCGCLPQNAECTIQHSGGREMWDLCDNSNWETLPKLVQSDWEMKDDGTCVCKPKMIGDPNEGCKLKDKKKCNDHDQCQDKSQCILSQCSSGLKGHKCDTDFACTKNFVCHETKKKCLKVKKVKKLGLGEKCKIGDKLNVCRGKLTCDVKEGRKNGVCSK